MSSVVGSDHSLDFITLRMHWHRRIGGGTRGIHSGAQAEYLMSALTYLSDGGLAAATKAPSQCWATW
jgi:hypothetical protein